MLHTATSWGPRWALTVCVLAAPAIAADLNAPPPTAPMAPTSTKPTAAPPKAPGPLEVLGDPWLPGPPLMPGGQGGIASVARGQFESIQVNVDRFGMNIPGDAANEPSIAVDPSAPNRLSIGWRQFDSVLSNFRQAGVAYSVDGGRTWTFPGVLQPGVFRSDPVLGADQDGTFYYYSLQSGFECDMWTSGDQGQTWAGPFPAFGGDKAWMTIDNTGGIGDGNIYTNWSVFGNNYFPDTFTRSVTGGVSFSDPATLPTTPVWGTCAVDGTGRLYITGVQGQPFDLSTFYVISSDDAQDPFDVPMFTPSPIIDLGGAVRFQAGPNPGGLLGQVSIGVDRSGGEFNGNVYILASVDPPGADPLDVHFSRSDDGGRTWSTPLRVNNDAPDSLAWQWFGTMSVAPNGRIDVIWNDTRNDPDDASTELYYAFSTDAGQSFSANVPLSPEFDHSLGYPNQAKLGDYYDLVSDNVGAHLAWAATFSGGQDVYYLRIGDYDCNGNDIGDSQDLIDGTSDDCNANGIPDECEIAAGTAPDTDGDGVIDGCEQEIPGDVNGDGVVNVDDLVAVILAWGPCPKPPADCPEDVDGNGEVDVDDLVAVILNWS